MTVRRLVALLVLPLAVVVSVLLAGGGEDEHTVHVTVPEAANVVVGQDVRSGGVKVGSVARLDPVDGGRAARLTLHIEDRAWPLTDRSALRLRWGGTANFSNRYLALDLGAPGGRPVADGGTLRTAQLATPVEFDQLLRTFPPAVRTQTRRFLDNAGAAMDRSGPALRRTLDVAPQTLAQAGVVLDDLDADEQALHGLVTSVDGVLGQVDAARPGTRELISGASDTFTAVAAEARGLQATLDRAPGTFATARTTLARADRTLGLAQDVVGRAGPGVTSLRRIATPLNRLLGRVTEVAPDATATLKRLSAATPDLDRLLARATTDSPQLRSIGAQAIDNLQCIRPYTPSAIAFFTNWGDFFSAPDGEDKVIRATVQNYFPASTNISDMTPGQAAKAYPGLTYGFPRPPGTNAGQPWFLPECGAGPDALDPSKDPEARRAVSRLQRVGVEGGR